jgi:predicted DCC family thiol-disulfide oxidoreductase YuxK
VETAKPSGSESTLTIFFDGVCNLCNQLVDWLLKRDKKNLFRFASLQGETAKTSLSETLRTSMASIVLVAENGEQLTESDAVIEILRHLENGAAWAQLLKLIPRPLRDFGYRWVAKHRYQIFGKRQACRLPSAEEKSKFLP